MKILFLRKTLKKTNRRQTSLRMTNLRKINRKKKNTRDRDETLLERLQEKLQTY